MKILVSFIEAIGKSKSPAAIRYMSNSIAIIVKESRQAPFHFVITLAKFLGVIINNSTEPDLKKKFDIWFSWLVVKNLFDTSLLRNVVDSFSGNNVTPLQFKKVVTSPISSHSPIMFMNNPKVLEQNLIFLIKFTIKLCLICAWKQDNVNECNLALETLNNIIEQIFNQRNFGNCCPPRILIDIKDYFLKERLLHSSIEHQFETESSLTTSKNIQVSKIDLIVQIDDWLKSFNPNTTVLENQTSSSRTHLKLLIPKSPSINSLITPIASQAIPGVELGSTTSESSSNFISESVANADQLLKSIDDPVAINIDTLASSDFGEINQSSFRNDIDQSTFIEKGEIDSDRMSITPSATSEEYTTKQSSTSYPAADDLIDERELKNLLCETSFSTNINTLTDNLSLELTENIVNVVDNNSTLSGSGQRSEIYDIVEVIEEIEGTPTKISLLELLAMEIVAKFLICYEPSKNLIPNMDRPGGNQNDYSPMLRAYTYPNNHVMNNHMMLPFSFLNCREKFSDGESTTTTADNFSGAAATTRNLTVTIQTNALKLLNTCLNYVNAHKRGLLIISKTPIRIALHPSPTFLNAETTCYKMNDNVEERGGGLLQSSIFFDFLSCTNFTDAAFVGQYVVYITRYFDNVTNLLNNNLHTTQDIKDEETLTVMSTKKQLHLILHMIKDRLRRYLTGQRVLGSSPLIQNATLVSLAITLIKKGPPLTCCNVYYDLLETLAQLDPSPNYWLSKVNYIRLIMNIDWLDLIYEQKYNDRFQSPFKSNDLIKTFMDKIYSFVLEDDIRVREQAIKVLIKLIRTFFPENCLKTKSDIIQNRSLNVSRIFDHNAAISSSVPTIVSRIINLPYPFNLKDENIDIFDVNDQDRSKSLQSFESYNLSVLVHKLLTTLATTDTKLSIVKVTCSVIETLSQLAAEFPPLLHPNIWSISYSHETSTRTTNNNTRPPTTDDSNNMDLTGGQSIFYDKGCHKKPPMTNFDQKTLNRDLQFNLKFRNDYSILAFFNSFLNIEEIVLNMSVHGYLINLISHLFISYAYENSLIPLPYTYFHPFSMHWPAIQDRYLVLALDQFLTHLLRVLAICCDVIAVGGLTASSTNVPLHRRHKRAPVNSGLLIGSSPNSASISSFATNTVNPAPAGLAGPEIPTTQKQHLPSITTSSLNMVNPNPTISDTTSRNTTMTYQNTLPPPPYSFSATSAASNATKFSLTNVFHGFFGPNVTLPQSPSLSRYQQNVISTRENETGNFKSTICTTSTTTITTASTQTINNSIGHRLAANLKRKGSGLLFSSSSTLSRSLLPNPDLNPLTGRPPNDGQTLPVSAASFVPTSIHHLSEKLLPTSTTTAHNSQQRQYGMGTGGPSGSGESNSSYNVPFVNFLHYEGIPLYRKLFEVVKRAYLAYTSTLKVDSEQKYHVLLSQCLSSLRMLLEIMSFYESSKIIDSLMSSCLSLTLAPAPELTISVATQLLKSIFGTNTLYTAKRVPSKQDNHQFDKNSIERLDRQYFASSIPCCNNDKNVIMSYLVWKRRLDETPLHLLPLLPPPPPPPSIIIPTPKNQNILNTNEAASTSYNNPPVDITGCYIRKFENIVIRVLKLYTITSDFGVQNGILDMLIELILLRVNYRLLDSDQLFLDYLIKQIEFIEQGYYQDCPELVYKLFQFFSLLTQGDFGSPKDGDGADGATENSKIALLTLPKLINLAETIVATTTDTEARFLPCGPLVVLIQELFLCSLDLSNFNIPPGALPQKENYESPALDLITAEKATGNILQPPHFNPTVSTTTDQQRQQRDMLSDVVFTLLCKHLHNYQMLTLAAIVLNVLRNGSETAPAAATFERYRTIAMKQFLNTYVITTNTTTTFAIFISNSSRDIWCTLTAILKFCRATLTTWWSSSSRPSNFNSGEADIQFLASILLPPSSNNNNNNSQKNDMRNSHLNLADNDDDNITANTKRWILHICGISCLHDYLNITNNDSKDAFFDDLLKAISSNQQRQDEEIGKDAAESDHIHENDRKNQEHFIRIILEFLETSTNMFLSYVHCENEQQHSSCNEKGANIFYRLYTFHLDALIALFNTDKMNNILTQNDRTTTPIRIDEKLEEILGKRHLGMNSSIIMNRKPFVLVKYLSVLSNFVRRPRGPEKRNLIFFNGEDDINDRRNFYRSLNYYIYLFGLIILEIRKAKKKTITLSYTKTDILTLSSAIRAQADDNNNHLLASDFSILQQLLRFLFVDETEDSSTGSYFLNAVVSFIVDYYVLLNVPTCKFLSIARNFSDEQPEIIQLSSPSSNKEETDSGLLITFVKRIGYLMNRSLENDDEDILGLRRGVFFLNSFRLLTHLHSNISIDDGANSHGQIDLKYAITETLTSCLYWNGRDPYLRYHTRKLFSADAQDILRIMSKNSQNLELLSSSLVIKSFQERFPQQTLEDMIAKSIAAIPFTKYDFDVELLIKLSSNLYPNTSSSYLTICNSLMAPAPAAAANDSTRFESLDKENIFTLYRNMIHGYTRGSSPWLGQSLLQTQIDDFASFLTVSEEVSMPHLLALFNGLKQYLYRKIVRGNASSTPMNFSYESTYFTLLCAKFFGMFVTTKSLIDDEELLKNPDLKPERYDDEESCKLRCLSVATSIPFLNPILINKISFDSTNYLDTAIRFFNDITSSHVYGAKSQCRIFSLTLPLLRCLGYLARYLGDTSKSLFIDNSEHQGRQNSCGGGGHLEILILFCENSIRLLSNLTQSQTLTTTYNNDENNGHDLNNCLNQLIHWFDTYEKCHELASEDFNRNANIDELVYASTYHLFRIPRLNHYVIFKQPFSSSSLSNAEPSSLINEADKKLKISSPTGPDNLLKDIILSCNATQDMLPPQSYYEYCDLYHTFCSRLVKIGFADTSVFQEAFVILTGAFNRTILPPIKTTPKDIIATQTLHPRVVGDNSDHEPDDYEDNNNNNDHVNHEDEYFDEDKERENFEMALITVSTITILMSYTTLWPNPGDPLSSQFPDVEGNLGFFKPIDILNKYGQGLTNVYNYLSICKYPKHWTCEIPEWPYRTAFYPRWNLAKLSLRTIWSIMGFKCLPKHKFLEIIGRTSNESTHLTDNNLNNVFNNKDTESKYTSFFPIPPGSTSLSESNQLQDNDNEDISYYQTALNSLLEIDDNDTLLIPYEKLSSAFIPTSTVTNTTTNSIIFPSSYQNPLSSASVKYRLQPPLYASMNSKSSSRLDNTVPSCLKLLTDISNNALVRLLNIVVYGKINNNDHNTLLNQGSFVSNSDDPADDGGKGERELLDLEKLAYGDFTADELGPVLSSRQQSNSTILRQFHFLPRRKLLLEIIKSVIYVSDLFVNINQWEWMQKIFCNLYDAFQDEITLFSQNSSSFGGKSTLEFSSLLSEEDSTNVLRDELISSYLILGLGKSSSALGLNSVLCNSLRKLVTQSLKSSAITTKILMFKTCFYILESNPFATEQLISHVSNHAFNLLEYITPDTLVATSYVETLTNLLFYLAETFQNVPVDVAIIDEFSSDTVVDSYVKKLVLLLKNKLYASPLPSSNTNLDSHHLKTILTTTNDSYHYPRYWRLILVNHQMGNSLVPSTVKHLSLDNYELTNHLDRLILLNVIPNGNMLDTLTSIALSGLIATINTDPSFHHLSDVKSLTNHHHLKQPSSISFRISANNFGTSLIDNGGPFSFALMKFLFVSLYVGRQMILAKSASLNSQDMTKKSTVSTVVSHQTQKSTFVLLETLELLTSDLLSRSSGLALFHYVTKAGPAIVPQALLHFSFPADVVDKLANRFLTVANAENVSQRVLKGSVDPVIAILHRTFLTLSSSYSSSAVATKLQYSPSSSFSSSFKRVELDWVFVIVEKLTARIATHFKSYLSSTFDITDISYDGGTGKKCLLANICYRLWMITLLLNIDTDIEDYRTLLAYLSYRSFCSHQIVPDLDDDRCLKDTRVIYTVFERFYGNLTSAESKRRFKDIVTTPFHHLRCTVPTTKHVKNSHTHKEMDKSVGHFSCASGGNHVIDLILNQLPRIFSETKDPLSDNVD